MQKVFNAVSEFPLCLQQYFMWTDVSIVNFAIAPKENICIASIQNLF